MDACRLTFALLVLVAGSSACRSSSPAPAPTSAAASIAIVGLTATVEPLTMTPQPGLLYILRYQVRESGGRTGATLARQRFELSNGYSTEAAFSGTPRVGPALTVPLVSTLSIFPASTAASRVVFTVTFNDDDGRAGTATASADIVAVER